MKISKEKIKGFGSAVKASAKKNPKLYATIIAAIVVATGGSAGTAAGIIEVASMLDLVGDAVGTLTMQ